jgi:hypothetical protein
MDKYDVKVVPTRWGNTPQNQVDQTTEFGKKVFANVITELNRKPDIFMQMSVANEFEAKGNFNIGITAGVETTILPKEFIDGSNKMDMVIVPSQFTKNLMLGTAYQEKNNQTGQIVNEFRISKPVEVLFEGVNTEIYSNPVNSLTELDKLETDFNFLFVGHWLKGNLGQDRKDVGMVIKTFATVFKYLPKDKRPGLIMKTSHAGFSVMDREATRDKIDNILKPFGKDAPKVYLLHGDLTDDEMASLYHHPKVKAMVSFTKGEGYGRPLAEFTMTGKPIVVSGWSGQMDFLPKEHTIFLEGSLTNIDESAVDTFILANAQWFSVNYSDAANKLYKVFNDYDVHLKQSAGLKSNTLKNFTLEKMHEVFKQMMERYEKGIPQVKPFNLPNLNKNKMELPKLNKV